MASSRPILYPSHVEVVECRVVCCCHLCHRSALHVILVSVYTLKKNNFTVQLVMINACNG
jgi:hypothetical protein